MRNHAGWHSRARALVRHAAAAAGLGIGWLILSGGAASATPGSPDDLLAAVVAPPASQASSSSADPSGAAGLVGAAVRTTTPLTADPTGTVAGLTTTATSTMASDVRALPTTVDPLTEGLLAPLSPIVAPVVDDAGGALGGALEVVGSAAQTAADAGSAVLPLHVVPLAPAEKPAIPLADSSLAASSITPGEPSTVASDGDLGAAAANAALPAPADPTVDAMLAGPMMRAATAAVEAGFRPQLSDGPAPGWPAAPALPPAPGSAGGAVFSFGGDASGLASLAAVGFALALAWRAGPLTGRGAFRLPAAPAFDPGSTPD